jgi:pimeloyl-ACP methyl ester carboxylesterase
MAELDQHRAGSGEPLVLIHGVGSCWQLWEPVLEPLEAQFDVLAPSLPGFGRSPPLEEMATVPALVRALERAMDAAGFETAHIAGNSMGGWVAAELAAGGRARSVTAISPAGLATRGEQRYSRRVLGTAYAFAQRILPLGERLSQSAAGRRFLWRLACAHPERMTPESCLRQIEALAGSPSFMTTLSWMNDGSNQPEGLESIHCPFKVLWGTDDMILPPRQAARWERIVPGCGLIALPRAGHFGMVDDAQATVQAITDAAALAAAGTPEAVAQ